MEPEKWECFPAENTCILIFKGSEGKQGFWAFKEKDDKTISDVHLTSKNNY